MKIALCVICKDEEVCIKRCIESVGSIVDEMIIVDTGSTDHTKQIVKDLGCTLYEIEWENDFSKARNYAIDKCQSDWIIFLDADEYFSKESSDNIPSIINKAEKLKKDMILTEILNLKDEGIGTSFKTIRIFKNAPYIRYTGRIHERLTKVGGELEGIDAEEILKVYHDGYITAVLEKKDKKQRNITMLLRELEEKPNNSDICFYLMQEYYGQGEYKKAWEYGVDAIKYNNKTLDSIYEVIYRNLLAICVMENKDFKTTETIFDKALKVCQQYPDFDYMYAEYLYHNREYSRSIEHLEKCMTKIENYTGCALSNVTCNVSGVLEMLAKVCIEHRDYGRAVNALVKILQIDLYALNALFNLIQIVSKQDSTEAIGAFLCKLYNMNNPKDQLVLLSVCKKLDNQSLYNYFWKRASEAIKLKMPMWQ